MLKKALLPLAIVAVYASALRAPFVYDDKMEVVGNRTIRFLDQWAAIATYNYARPLLIATYALDWRLNGLDPLGYHLVSLALHLVNTWLALRLAQRLLAPEKAALVAATWALHPLCTESVTYITGRSDALVATWMFLGLAAWIDFVRGGGRRPALLAAGALVLGLLSKEIAVVLPVLWLAADLWLVNGGRWALVEKRRYVPVAVVVGGAVAVRLGVYGWPAAEVPRTFAEHVFTQAEVWVAYLRLWLLPYGQSILHDYPSHLAWQGAVALGLLAALLREAVRRRGVVAFAALTWALVLAVSSAFILKETMAEHRTYVAGFGLVLGLGAVVPYRRGLWVVPVVLAALTAWRNLDWRSEVTLWAGTTTVNPDSAEAWYGYGDALRFAGRDAEAEAAYRESLRLAPERPDTVVNLGITRAEQGDAAGAKALWEQALRMKPGHCAALNDLASLSARQGDRIGAIGGYMGTLRFCPGDPMALQNLGDLYWELGDITRAAGYYAGWLEGSPAGPKAKEAQSRVDQVRKAGLAPR